MPLWMLLSVALARPLAGNAWVMGTMKVPVADTVNVFLAPEARYDVTDGITDRLLTTLGASWRAHENLKLGVHYRADLREWAEDGGPELAQRAALDVAGILTFGGVQLSLRQRLQPEWRLAQDDVFTNVLRTRLQVTVDGGAAVPKLSVEPYVVAGPRDAFLQRMRFDLGIGVPYGALTWELVYRIDEPVGQPGALQEHIVLMAGSWKLDLRQHSAVIVRDEDDPEAE